MKLRHLRTLYDLGSDGIEQILERASELKRLRGRAEHPHSLRGKSIGILLEKASTRTRISFEVGIYELGGLPVAMTSDVSQLGRGETVEDTAKVLSRYLHAVVYRAHGQAKVEALAANASIPVINGLSDTYHPCQVLADLLTVRENLSQPWRDISVVWIGDGNNMAHSWMNAAALLGFELRYACPPAYAPDPSVVATAKAKDAHLRAYDSVSDATRDVHVVTTDVWASMGQEEERRQRAAALAGYSVTEKLMATAAPGAIFLHCLPAHRGEEVAAEVIDGPASRVWDEAENRLHVQKALLEYLLGHA